MDVTRGFDQFIGARVGTQPQIEILHRPAAIEFRAERAAQRATAGDVQIATIAQRVANYTLAKRRCFLGSHSCSFTPATFDIDPRTRLIR